MHEQPMSRTGCTAREQRRRGTGPRACRSGRRAVTLLELTVAIVVMGIIAAIVVPQFTGVTDEARSSATRAVVSSVRSAIASFRTEAVVSGADPFPTLAELTTPGVVMQLEIPANPFTGVSGVQAVDATQAADRAVSNEATFGWNYYVDNSATPPTAVFYANSDHATTIEDAGTMLEASEL